MLSFFPRDVLDEILNLIESVSEDFPSYSFTYSIRKRKQMANLLFFYRIFQLNQIISSNCSVFVFVTYKTYHMESYNVIACASKLSLLRTVRIVVLEALIQ